MGKSKKTTIGYRYFMGLHMGLCRGPVDAIRQIRVGGKVAWTGKVTSNSTIRINQPNLFGGDEQEGGVDGELVVLMGHKDQPRHAGLATMLGGLVSAFRGVATMYFDGLVCAMSPYPKEWTPLVQKTKAGWHNNQVWFPEMAEIWMSGYRNDYNDQWAYKVEEPGSSADYSSANFDDSTWPMGRGGFGTNAPPGSSLTVGTFVPGGVGRAVWIRRQINIPADVTVNIYHDDGAWLWVDGVAQPLESISYYHSRALLPAGMHQLALKVMDGVPSGSPNMFAGIAVESEDADLQIYGMNPAHILYRLYTDPRIGRGLKPERLDDESWRAAAATWYSEGLGLCMKWSRSGSIAEFAQSVIDHAGAVIYTSRSTSKLVLKAIRDDYELEDLPLFTPDTGLLSVEDDATSTQQGGINEIIVKYFDPLEKSDKAVREKNLGLVLAMNGITTSEEVEYKGVPTEALARRLARRDLKAKSGLIKRFKVRLDRRAAELMPGHVFRISDPERGIANMVLRAGKVEHGQITDGAITVTALQDVFGLPANVYRAPEENGYVPPNSSPRVPSIQTAMEVPFRELVQALGQAQALAIDPAAGYLHAGAVAPTALSESFALDARVAPADFKTVVESGAFCPGGFLAEAIDAFAISAKLKEGIGLSEVDIGSAALIGSEIVRVDAIDLTTSIVTIARGCADTVPAPHGADTSMICYDLWGADDKTEYIAGVSVEAKLRTRTSQGLLSSGLAPTQVLTFASRAARPYPPGRLKINGKPSPDALATGNAVVEWVHRDRTIQADQLIDADQASIGPETGTTYSVECFYGEDAVPVHTETGLLGTSATVPFGSAGTYRLTVKSHRDGLECWQSQAIQLDVSGALPWTPAALLVPVKIWLDWSNLPESGTVSLWENKGTSATSFVQDVPGQRPSVAVSSDIGKKVAVFDGIDDRLYANLPDYMRKAPASWFFALYKRKSASYGHRRLITVVHNYPNAGWSRFTAFVSGESSLGGLAPWTQSEGVAGGGEVNATESGANPVTDWGVHYFERDFSGGTSSIWSDGKRKAHVTGQPTATSSDVQNSPIYIGSNQLAAAQFGDMDLACLMSDDHGSLPTSERQRLEGWAVHQAGLTTVLPVDHPFKAIQPYLSTPVLQTDMASAAPVIGFLAGAVSGRVGLSVGSEANFGILFNAQPILASGDSISVASEGGLISTAINIAGGVAATKAKVMTGDGELVAEITLTADASGLTGTATGSLLDAAPYYFSLEM